VNVDGRRIRVYFGRELACIQLSGNFDGPPFTVNAPDYFGKTTVAGTVQIGPEKLTVFSTDGNITGIQ
jgi:hypothetical protein